MNGFNQPTPQMQPTNSPPQTPIPPVEENRNWLKWVLIVGVVALLSSGTTYLILQSQSQKQPPIPTPSPVTQITPSLTTDETANWKIYTSQEGKYSIKYPSNIKVYVNEKFSVDGVRVPLKDTVVFFSDTLPQINTNYQMSINHKLFNGTLQDFVDKNSSCTEIQSGKGKTFTLGTKQALIFEDTPCGPYGTTAIYVLNNGLGYVIETETHAMYSDIKKYINQILSTFQFTN